MKLKHKWPAIIIWVLFVIFDVLMVAGSGYTSGLFPEINTVLYTLTFTVLGIAIMNTLTYFLGNLSDSLELYKASENKACNVIYTVMMIAIVIGAYITRFLCLANSSAEISGQLSLYENAVIGGNNKVPDNGLLSVAFSKILSGILLFTGNRISMAYIFSAVLSCVFIILTANAVKLLLGKVASIVYAAFVSFMPAFLDSFLKLELTTDPLFLCLFGIELLFIAFYLRRASDNNFGSKAWIPWYILVGAVIGFMGYVDAGTFLVVLPLLISALIVKNSTVVKELTRLLFVIVGAALAFFGMILQEGGVAGFGKVFDNWHKYFFHNVNTFDAFWTYTDYKLIYLITVIAMSGVIVGFWKNRKEDKVSPFLLSMLILFAATPLLGATRMNSKLMITIFYGIILACVAALIVTESSEDEEEPESEGVDAHMGTSEVVTPEAEEEPEEEESEPETTPEPELASENEEPEPAPEPEESAHIPAPAPKAEEPRFVPEGMVLPEETEADADEVKRERPKKKVPQFEGKISLNRKNDHKDDNNDASNMTFKDDFDISFEDGDDFDI
ncbi:hypothetical protein [Butyrivibrio sp. INlla21]|uniref:hypothetical protein n=1 Tax=Butyrivibrio sp. INlla21 TaxID=1520811 RepID=UPI0008ED8D0B|nr:hypothetical protein [Butyrivibrio sp. INlla21]SFU98123.1 hypothetical protein SAMN02910342_02725 [Butyrivibrio sp. INlla21]